MLIACQIFSAQGSAPIPEDARGSYHMTQDEYIAVEGTVLDLQNMALKMLLLKWIAEK